MRSKPFTTYRQLDAMDCGPVCLKMIFKYYGKLIDLDTLKRQSGLGTQGVSLLSLAETAEQYGFYSACAKITFEQLINDVPLPCVLFWDQYHFVVLTPAANKKKITVADPARGLVTHSKEDFLPHWIAANEEGEPKGIVLVLTPTPTFDRQEDTAKANVGWGTLGKYLLKYKKEVFQLACSLLLGSLLQLVFPYLTQSIVDTGINTQNLPFIQIILIAQFALFFARTFVDFIRSRILLFVSSHVNFAIVSDFWIKLMRLPMSFFDTKQAGDIFQRIGDQRRIENFITGSTLETMFSFFNLVIFSGVLLLYDSSIFAIFFAGSGLYFLWIRLFLKDRRLLDHQRFAVASQENLATMQLIYGMREIKLNNAEHLKRWQWEGLQASHFKLNFRSLSLNQYQQAGAFFINEGKNILIIYLAARLVLEGQLTLGAMLAIIYIMGQLNGPVEQIITFIQLAQDAKMSLERLNEIHQLPEEEPKDAMFVEQIPANASIVFKNLGFTYPGVGNAPVLSDVNLEFGSGKVTAIVGLSGSGKTTLLKLIQKFHDAYEGEIRIGPHNFKNISPYYWRSISSSVMQDGYIFNDSIAKNIAVGDQHPRIDRLLEACQVANILEFIETLPLGFNTQIGDTGHGLSAGQKQRILIARAVYKNPAFIFFDEATNALDANNEKVIIENLQEFFRGRTVVVVAHRLSTVKYADKIVVLQHGHIIEEGTHEQLVYGRGKYYELVKNQLELGN